MSAEAATHPYYGILDEVLKRRGFDGKVDHLCMRYYHEKLGCPSLAPGVRIGMLMLG